MQVRAALKQLQRLVLQVVFQLQWARVDPVGLRDIALAAAREVITAGLSGIRERTPVGTFLGDEPHNDILKSYRLFGVDIG